MLIQTGSTIDVLHLALERMQDVGVATSPPRLKCVSFFFFVSFLSFFVPAFRFSVRLRELFVQMNPAKGLSATEHGL